MSVRPRTGELWWATPDPAVGREQAGCRPVLVVANDRYLDVVTSLVIVVPVTSVERGWLNHVRVDKGTDLGRPSFAMTEQVRTISRDRLVSRAGQVPDDVLDVVLSWVRAWTD